MKEETYTRLIQAFFLDEVYSKGRKFKLSCLTIGELWACVPTDWDLACLLNNSSEGEPIPFNQN